jgi:hypothetical protein
MDSKEKIDTAIATLEQAMQALRDLGLLTEGNEDE